MLRADGQSAMSVDELPRLDELRRYELFEGGSEEAFDRLAELAAHACAAPTAVISFVDDRQQRFFARWNVPNGIGEAIPRELSICAVMIERPYPLAVIEDLAEDPRFARSPLVQRQGFRFYASVPLVTPGGYTLGTVCVVDQAPRSLAAVQARMLTLVRDQVMELLEARRELGELRRSEALRQEAVEALVATQRDLQQRIELRTREIEAAHQKTRTILERIGDAYLVLDRQGRLVYVNPRASQILGRAADELVGKELWTEFPGGGGALRGPYDRALADKSNATVEVHYAPWDRWFEGRIYPSPDGGAAMVFTEISDRKRAEAAAEEIRHRLVEAQRVAHVGSFEFDIANDRVVWSDETYRIYGVPIGETIAGYRGFLGRVHPDDLERTQRIVGEAIAAGAKMVYDHRIVRDDGSVRILHTRAEA
ncbi:MAG TPA: PAS domain-containing protein, partial [Polyangia bacterium]